MHFSAAVWWNPQRRCCTVALVGPVVPSCSTLECQRECGAVLSDSRLQKSLRVIRYNGKLILWVGRCRGLRTRLPWMVGAAVCPLAVGKSLLESQQALLGSCSLLLRRHRLSNCPGLPQWRVLPVRCPLLFAARPRSRALPTAFEEKLAACSIANGRPRLVLEGKTICALGGWRL